MDGFRFWLIGLILVIISLPFLSCKEEVKGSGGLISLDKSDESLILNSYFSNIESVVFDENELIGQIDKVIVTDSKIIVSDFDITKTLKVFDRHGGFVVGKDDFGSDPLAMGYFEDFDVFDNKMYVLDGAGRKVLVFDFRLQMLEEIPIFHPAAGLLVNQHGVFLYHLSENPEFPFQLSFLSHDTRNLVGLIPVNPKLSHSPFSGSFFIKMDEDRFVHYHPGLDSLWLFEGTKFNSFRIDFGNQFIDLNQTKDLHPLEHLKFYNSFEGFKNLSYGIKLGERSILLGASFENKPHFLRIDFDSKNATLHRKIRNDLKPLPSNILFNGNSGDAAWYFQFAEQVGAFYEMNESKIPVGARIDLPKDAETSILFLLKY